MKKIFKKNNGFTGVDISISILVILIFVPTIFGVVYNIQKTNAGIERKTNAVNIATDVLEIVKSEQYSDITVSNSKLVTDLNNKYTKSSYKNTEKEEDGYNYIYYSTKGSNNESYQIQLGIKNYYPSLSKTEDYVKEIKVRVFYFFGNSVKDIDIGIVVKTNT